MLRNTCDLSIKYMFKVSSSPVLLLVGYNVILMSPMSSFVYINGSLKTKLIYIYIYIYLSNNFYKKKKIDFKKLSE